jgi:hypothetical protein
MNSASSDDPTDLSGLPCPSLVFDAVSGDRYSFIQCHGFDIDLDWWNTRIDLRGLPGGPISGTREGIRISSGSARIERQDLFSLADEACSTPLGALSLLWHSLAWGSGIKRRQDNKRLESVAANVESISSGLQDAAMRSREDCRAAFLLCCPRPNRNLVKYLGPAFVTKFLYFAGAGQPDHPCLILDNRVATTLHDQAGWDSLDTSGAGNWPSETYQRYCDLLHRWSLEESQTGRVIYPDELERALFDFGA